MTGCEGGTERAAGEAATAQLGIAAGSTGSSFGLLGPQLGPYIQQNEMIGYNQTIQLM
jgi:hypothetical protein